MTFATHLTGIQSRKQSLLCVGLDIDPAKMPKHFKRTPDGIGGFLGAIIEATHDLVCAYKPNLAFFEALGDDGWTILRKTMRRIPRNIVTIGDGKRGDIGNTGERYAVALFDDLGFDAVTVSPYMGRDSVEPFLMRSGKGAFVLALTSNPGSVDFQRQKVGRSPLYESVVKTSLTWDIHASLGFVVGATHPKELRRIRTLAPDVPFLIPGVGSQGGDLEASVRYGCVSQGRGAVINASRSILYASSGKDFDLAARTEAQRLRDAMERSLAD